MLKKYVAREPEVYVVHTSNKDDATIAVAGVIYQDTDPQPGEVPDLGGYHQTEGVRDVKLGDELSEDHQCMLEDLIQRHTVVFTDMPGETNQHKVKLTNDTPIVVSFIPCCTL